MTTPEPLPLREAVASALRMGGLEILSQPQRFTSYILDLADSSLREVRLLSRQLDTELVAPLAQATKGECTTATLLTARSRIEQILVDDRFVSEDLARSTAEGLVGGMADFMGLRLPSAVQRLSPQPVQKDEDTPKPRLEPRPTQQAPTQPALSQPKRTSSQRTWQQQPRQAPQPAPRQQVRPQASPVSATRTAPTTTPTKPAKKGRAGKIIFILMLIVFIVWPVWYFSSMPSSNQIKATASFVNSRGSYDISQQKAVGSLINNSDIDCVVKANLRVESPDGILAYSRHFDYQYFAAHTTLDYEYRNDTHVSWYNYTIRIDYTLQPYNPLFKP